MDFQGTILVQQWLLWTVLFLSGAVISGLVWVVWYVRCEPSRASTFGGGRDSNEPRWQFADVQFILAVCITGAFLGVVFAFIFHPPSINEGQKDVLTLLIGGLMAKFGDIIAYFYNSTAQSKQKDATAEQAVKTAAVSASNTEKMLAVAAPVLVPVPAVVAQKQQAVQSAGEQYTRNEITEEAFIVMLRALGLINGEITVAIEQYKPKNGELKK